MAQVKVTLKNPPSGATLWQLILCDWGITVAVNQIGGTVPNDVAAPITFEVPSGVTFPLRIVSLQVSKWNADRTAIIVLYEIQSMHANQYNWDTGTYTGPPDPSYRAIFIPDYGSYYYNVATEQFEPIEVAYPADIVGLSAPISVTAGETALVDVSVKNIGASDYYIAVTGTYDSTPLAWQFDYLLVSPGQTVVMRGNFIMPSNKVGVTVWSWHWDGSKWVQDDTGYVDILVLAAVPQPEFTGFGITDYSKV